MPVFSGWVQYSGPLLQCLIEKAHLDMDTGMQFDIRGWRAWAPGLSTNEDWNAWLRQPVLAAAGMESTQPDVSFLPAMQRRRLSPLARMAFQVAWPLADMQNKQPVVFCSRHGETPHNLGLLTELGKGESLSPTRFSLSVHNAVIGLWSMFRDDTSEMTAIAATENGLEQAVLEAVLLLHAGANSVLVIVAEEQQPELYQPWIDDVPFAHALALQIMPGNNYSLRMQAEAKTATDDHRVPPALRVLPLLLGTQRAVDCGHWQWQCNKS